MAKKITLNDIAKTLAAHGKGIRDLSLTATTQANDNSPMPTEATGPSSV